MDILTITDVVSLLCQDERFSGWDVQTESEQVHILSWLDRQVVLVSAEFFHTENRVEIASLDGARPGSSLLVVGPIANLEPASEYLLTTASSSSSQLLALPTSIPLLLAALRCPQETDVQAQLDRSRYENELLVDIGRALSQERDTRRLLELILLRAREVTGADAGSVYVVEGTEEDLTKKVLRFTESQNDSRTICSEGFTMPVSSTSIVGTCVLSGEVVNIPDLYRLDAPGEGNNPWGFVHDKSFDEQHEYQTRSVVNVPMISARGDVIGVIQLINKRRAGLSELGNTGSFVNKVIPFDEISIRYATTLASQACIALENSLLYDEVKTLFEGFVHASVSAIESRDPTTSGHSERVADLTVDLAKVADRSDSGTYRNLYFSNDDIKQIEYAALLHDFGKVGVREHVLVKSKKLYSHEHALIKMRFEYIRQSISLEYQNRKFATLLASTREEAAEQLSQFDARAAEKIAELDDYLAFIGKANQPSILESGGFERLAEIATKKYLGASGDMLPYLQPEEVQSLQVSRGSLTPQERNDIESHVVHTYNFLKRIPWGRAYGNIPKVAGAHHEKLDGSGYPLGLHAVDIPAPAKMMTISDIFDALTASDRPYKKALPVTKALDIIGYEVKDGKLDSELFEMFVDAKVYEKAFAKRNS